MTGFALPLQRFAPRRKYLPVLLSALRLVGLIVVLALPASTFAQAPDNTQTPTESTTENADAAPEAVASDEAATPETTETAPPKIPPTRLKEQREQQWLADELPEETLTLGNEEDRFTARFQRAGTADVHGTLVLVDVVVAGGLPVWMELPRKHLPITGWNTLAISLPETDAVTIPAREFPAPISEATDAEQNDDAEPSEGASTESASETTDEATAASEVEQTDETAAADSVADAQALPVQAIVISREERVSLRLTAVAEWLRENDSGSTVWLLDTRNAPEVLTALQQEQSPVAALIMVNNQPQARYSAAATDALFSALHMPVLDVFLLPETPLVRAQKQMHRAAALRARLTHYRQSTLIPPAFTGSGDDQHYWVEQIRGWLRVTLEKEEEKEGR